MGSHIHIVYEVKANENKTLFERRWLRDLPVVSLGVALLRREHLNQKTHLYNTAPMHTLGVAFMLAICVAEWYRWWRTHIMHCPSGCVLMMGGARTQNAHLHTLMFFHSITADHLSKLSHLRISFVFSIWWYSNEIDERGGLNAGLKNTR